MTERPASSPLTRSLITAALILVSSAALALASPAYLSADLAQRLFGIMLGAVVVLYANAIPKALIPLARMRCDPATEQGLRRFTGWALVLGGMGYATAWLFAPMTSAWILAIALLGTALLAVLLRYAWVVYAKRSS